MNKIFITVFGDLTEAQALYRCAEVASEGRISQSVNGPCYAFVTTFTDGPSVRAERTKKGNDTFTVIGVPK